jgi:hypothetical protein
METERYIEKRVIIPLNVSAPNSSTAVISKPFTSYPIRAKKEKTP